VRDLPLWFRATHGRVIVGLALVTFTSLAGDVGRAQSTEADARSDRYVLQRSNVTFDVDAFSTSQIKMRFHRVEAQLEGTQAGLESGRVVVTIDAASVEAQPRFLSPIIRGGGILDVAHYPEIRFVSTGFVRTGEGSGWLFGNLTIHGITHTVSLLVTPRDAGGSPLPDGALAFSAAGAVSRREFGLSAWFPTVGDAVHLNIQVEFVRGP